MGKSVAAALSLAVLAAGCSGGGESGGVTIQAPKERPRTAVVQRYVRDYRRLGADVRAMRAQAAKVHRQSLQGTPALQRTTGRFIDDLDRSVLPPKARNRMIDHAAGAVATTCDQCFQMLEAIRPIPQIAGH